jgi:hypothetical protein
LASPQFAFHFGPSCAAIYHLFGPLGGVQEHIRRLGRCFVKSLRRTSGPGTSRKSRS